MRHPGYNSSLSLLSATIISIGPVFSAEHTWTGGVPLSSGSEFSLPENWNAAGVPVSGKNTDLLFGAVSGSGRLNPQQNLAAPLMLNQITFAAGAPSFTLAGQSLNPVQDSDANPARVVQNSGVTQTVQTPLNLPLLPLQLTGSGTGPLVINGAISGEGYVQVRYPSTVLSGANTQDRGTEIGIETATVEEATQGGHVVLGNAQALGRGLSTAYPNWRLSGTAIGQTVSSRVQFLPYTSTPGAGQNTHYFGFPGEDRQLNFTNTVSAATGRTLRIDNTRTTFSGGFGVGQELRKTGAGILRLEGVTTPAGGASPLITVEQGTLEAAHPQALTSAMSVHLGAGATLDCVTTVLSGLRLRSLTGGPQSRTIIGNSGLTLAPGSGQTVTYDGVMHLANPVTATGGALTVSGQATSRLKLTNWEVTQGVNGPQPVNVLGSLWVGSGAAELSDRAVFQAGDDTMPGAEDTDYRVVVLESAALDITGGSALHSSGRAHVQGGTVTVSGTDSSWRHREIGPASVTSFFLQHSSDGAASGHLIVENGGRAEFGRMGMSNLQAQPGENHIRVATGGTLQTRILSTEDMTGARIAVDGGTWINRGLSGDAEVAVGNGGEVRFDVVSDHIRASFVDLPAVAGQPSPGPGTVRLNSVISGAQVSGFSPFRGTFALSANTSVGVQNDILPNAVLDLGPGSRFMTSSTAGYQFGGLRGSGLLDCIAFGPSLTLGSTTMDADFSGSVADHSALIKIHPNRQIWRSTLNSRALQVKGGAFELTGAAAQAQLIGNATQTTLIVGTEAAVARLKIGSTAHVRTFPGSQGQSLITGVDGTNITVSGGGRWSPGGVVEIGKAVSPGLPEAGGRGEVFVTQEGILDASTAATEIKVGSAGGKGVLRATDGGLVLIPGAIRLGSTALNNVTSTGWLDVRDFGSVVSAGTITVGVDAPQTGTGQITISQSGVVVCNQLELRQTAQSITVDGGVLRCEGLSQSGTGTPTFHLADPPPVMGSAALVIAGSAGEMSLRANILGSGSIEKSGGSDLLLGGLAGHTGSTIVNGGSLELDTQMITASRISVLQGSLALNHQQVGNPSAIIDIAAQGRLVGPGTIRGTITNNGLVDLSGPQSLNLTGTVTNNGLMRFTRGATLITTGTFINRGIIDVISGEFIPPQGFVNEGIILDRHSVRISAIRKTGPDVRISIESLTGHSYQLERLPSLNGTGAVRLPLVQEGSTGTTLHFDDTPPAGGSRVFYRVLVDP